MTEAFLPFTDRLYQFLPGFVGFISLEHNFFGHSKRQTVGFSAYFLGIQPLPTPSPDAYTQPRNLGSPVTNSFVFVGSSTSSFSSVLQSMNACFAAGKSFHQTIHGFASSILLIGVISFSCWYCCCCMLDSSNQFFDSFEWNIFCRAHNLVQLRINCTLLVPRQFDAPCCAINHPT